MNSLPDRGGYMGLLGSFFKPKKNEQGPLFDGQDLDLPPPPPPDERMVLEDKEFLAEHKGIPDLPEKDEEGPQGADHRFQALDDNLFPDEPHTEMPEQEVTVKRPLELPPKKQFEKDVLDIEQTVHAQIPPPKRIEAPPMSIPPKKTEEMRGGYGARHEEIPTGYLDIDTFSQIVNSSDTLKAGLRKVEEGVSRMHTVQGEQSRLLEHWREQLEDAQKKLVYIDRTLFKTIG